MSSRGQANSSRSRKSREKQYSNTRDRSQDSVASDIEASNVRPRIREHGRTREATRSKASKSHCKVRDSKCFATLEKTPSSRNLSKKKDDKKGRGEKIVEDRKKEASESPVHEQHALFPQGSTFSKLIGELANLHEDASRRAQAARELVQYIQAPSNYEELLRNCSNIFVALEDVFNERCHNDIKDEIVIFYGSLAQILGPENERLFKWILSRVPIAPTEQLRIWYLRSVLEAMKLESGKQTFYNAMPRVMASLQDILENADTPELLLVVIDVICIISYDYPDIFEEYFKDIVDILVGWHIDITQSESLLKSTSECLIQFHAYWVADMAFSVTLLNQFIEDMEAYGEELNPVFNESIKDDAPSPFKVLPKLASLLSVFKTVVSCIGDYFIPGRGSLVDVGYINETVSRIIECVDRASCGVYYDKLFIYANNCIQTMVQYLTSQFASNCQKVAMFMNGQLQSDQAISFDHLKSILLLIEVIVLRVGMSIPVTFIHQLFCGESPVYRLRNLSDPESYSELLRMFQVLFSTRNIPLVQLAYEFLVLDLTKNYKFLKEVISSDDEETQPEAILSNVGGEFEVNHPLDMCNDPLDGSETEGNITIEEAHCNVIFDLTVLAEIVTYKSAVVGAWKVYPTTFSLLTEAVNPMDSEFAVRFPAVHYCIIAALFTHSQRCNHFLHLGNKTGRLLSCEFTEIVNLMFHALSHPLSSIELRIICSIWIADISRTVQRSSVDGHKVVESFSKMIDVQILSSYSIETTIAALSGLCLKAFLGAGIVADGLLARSLSENLIHLTDKRFGVQLEFLNVAMKFPLDVIASSKVSVRKSQYIGASQSSRSESKCITCERDMWLSRKCHMTRLATGTLNSSHFKRIMDHILNQWQSNTDMEWIEDIYHTCQRLGEVDAPVSGVVSCLSRFSSFDDSSYPRNLCCSQELLWFWALWESAQFCVSARLKTPLGKPMDTFQSIEDVLNDLEKELSLSVLNWKLPTEWNGRPCYEDLNFCADKLRQSILLLDFLEHLEKLLFNAFEGSACSLPQPTRGIRSFFRANRSSCQEWLLRICEPASRLASIVGFPASAVKYGFSWLQFLKENGNVHGLEFEKGVVITVNALSQLRASESIKGILEWCKIASGRSFFWLSGMIPKARGCFEEACKNIAEDLERYLSPDRHFYETIGEQKRKGTFTVLTKEPMLHSDPETVHFMANEVLECYVKLGDWDSVLHWCHRINDIKEHHECADGQGFKLDTNYVKAMMRFEDNDFVGVREQLELIPGATISSFLQEQFPVLGTIMEEKKHRLPSDKSYEDSNLCESRISLCSQSVLAMQSQLYLLQALSLYWTSGLSTLKRNSNDSLYNSSWQKVEDLLESARDILLMAVQNLYICNSPVNAAALLMQLKSVSSIRETIFPVNNEEEHEVVMDVSDVKSNLDPDTTDIGVMTEALRTANYIQYHNSITMKGWVAQTSTLSKKTSEMSSLQVVSARLARKQGNIKLAESLLAKQLLLSEGNGLCNGKLPGAGNIHLRLRQLSTSAHSGKVMDPLSVIEILLESAKLKRVLGQNSDAIDTLYSGIILAEKQYSYFHKHAYLSRLSEVSTRSVLTLVRWLLLDPKLLDTTASYSDDTSFFGGKIKDILKIVVKSGGLSMKLLQNSNISIVSMTECDKICGQLLHFATHRCPSSSKNWFTYADWCYRWGRKALEISRIELLDEERERILKLLPEGTEEEDIDSTLLLLSTVPSCRKNLEEEDSSEVSEASSFGDPDITLKQLYMTFPHLPRCQPSLTTNLLSAWKSVIDRVFFHYKQAIAAYFSFLRLGDNQFDDNDSTSRSEYGNITATLRLLRLLVKYSGELKQELKKQLSLTPTKPWKGIIPQLFARLSHPEIYVQQSIASLLCRIAKEFPHLIVYPSVVGCNDVIPSQISKTSAAGILKSYKLMDISDYCDQPQDIGDNTCPETEEIDIEEDQLLDSASDKVYQSSLHIILDSLSREKPLLVSEVTTVVKELRRITLLWDELWVGSLLQLNHDAQRRIIQLCEEIERVNANDTLSIAQKSSLIKEKHTALMRPLLYSLERLAKITMQTPETSHEVNFQQCYGSIIQETIRTLRMPLDSLDVKENWDPLTQLHGMMQSSTNRRSMTCLSMKEISPILATRQFYHVPMPGIDFTASHVVYLKSFADDVLILPTKTKPKKLYVNGSDGNRYTYLFKGLEDLHLDERIMQLLDICNHMFVKDNKSSVEYIARRYSVTPLGLRSGLIQWVDGSTPIFTIYKRWQQREMAAKSLPKVPQSNQEPEKPLPNAPLLRPSELFYSKISPLLKELGIHDLISNRKEWPLTVLRKVFVQLSSETPADLLAKEIWCASTSVTDWWKATTTYCRSVAVMSIIGYILGLGDRHLDNILVDLITGEVVHIDYNVCFEKGKILKVAEKVPFRMTKNMETALGLSGIEGLFRASCEKVLHVLRHGQETLLTLLEAFIYDPLVDWTTANDGAFAGAFYGGGTIGDVDKKYNKKEMERSITQTLLSTRVEEIRVLWTKNRDELHVLLGNLESSLHVYCSSLDHHEAIFNEIAILQKQCHVLNTALERDDHPIYSLQARYIQREKLLEQLNVIKTQLQNALDECRLQSNEHQSALATVRGKRIGELYSRVCQDAKIGPPSYESSRTFLQSAGQGNIVAQCDQIEADLTGFLNHQRSSLRACLDSLLSYAAIISEFPADYCSQVYCTSWFSWLENIFADCRSESCLQVLREHDDSIKCQTQSSKEADNYIISMESNLRQYFEEQNTKLVKLFDRRNQEPMEMLVLSNSVTETWNAIRKFVGETELSGATSLACVTITALVSLNSRFLYMENAASRKHPPMKEIRICERFCPWIDKDLKHLMCKREMSGERLIYLTSQDGDWFLDELSTMSGNIAQLLSVLKNNPLCPRTYQTQETVDQITTCMQAVFSSMRVYNSFQEFMTNFKTIIVPEALKLIRNEDESFLFITTALEDLTEGLPIAVLNLVEMFKGFPFEEGNDEVAELLKVVEVQRKALNDLIDPESTSKYDEERGPSDAKMTSGQMLLAGFSGLFTKFETEFSTLFEAFKKLQQSNVFENIELNQEQSFQMHKCLTKFSVKCVLDFLFVRRLQVMHGFFKSCMQQAVTARDLSLPVSIASCIGSDDNQGPFSKLSEHDRHQSKTFSVFNEELLSLPVKKFITDSVQSFILGLPSYSVAQLILYYLSLLNPCFAKDIKENKKITSAIEDLCKKAVDYNLQHASFTVQHLHSSSSLIHTHGAAWRKHDLVRRLEVAAAAQKDILHRAQMQLVRFQWLNEAVLCPPGKKHTIELANPSRHSLVNDLKKHLKTMLQGESNYTSLLERYTQLQLTIKQRLKWASGANPTLNRVLQEFERAAESRKALVSNENRLTVEVRILANAIVRLEAYHCNCDEAILYDSNIVSLVEKCSECCKSLEEGTEELGDIEQLMKNLKIPMPPDEPITAEWIRDQLENSEKKLKSLRTKERSSKHAISRDKDNVKRHVHSVKFLLSAHSSLVGDVKNLLKSLAKDEEAAECDVVRKFIASHNKFSEDASNVLKVIVQLCSTSKVDQHKLDVIQNSSPVAIDLATRIKDLVTLANWLHDELLRFGSNFFIDKQQMDEHPETFASALQHKMSPKLSGTSQCTVSSTVVGDSTDARKRMISPTIEGAPSVNAVLQEESVPPVRDPTAGKAQQEKNSFAVNVWQRVKAKLEGRDVDLNHAMTVIEQVDHIIKEATNADNLCQLYEGWTPWV